eukprot:TRINITY_DN90443_c0_g1_i1.p2 TRINITY_DN90443_c0_g1~~TRINITY_DN90443_c0_g1_i1.p2  ORF type:complete len:283 (+),score=50.12 TRINITY_DN90443_c0_g1_i1:85-849(+)
MGEHGRPGTGGSLPPGKLVVPSKHHESSVCDAPKMPASAATLETQSRSPAQPSSAAVFSCSKESVLSTHHVSIREKLQSQGAAILKQTTGKVASPRTRSEKTKKVLPATRVDPVIRNKESARSDSCNRIPLQGQGVVTASTSEPAAAQHADMKNARPSSKDITREHSVEKVTIQADLVGAQLDADFPALEHPGLWFTFAAPMKVAVISDVLSEFLAKQIKGVSNCIDGSTLSRAPADRMFAVAGCRTPQFVQQP